VSDRHTQQRERGHPWGIQLWVVVGCHEHSTGLCRVDTCTFGDGSCTLSMLA
jgi:hypothetical protein